MYLFNEANYLSLHHGNHYAEQIFHNNFCRQFNCYNMFQHSLQQKK